MARKKSTIAKTESPKTEEPKNMHGARAWEKSEAERFQQLMMTGGIANTFYMNQTEMIRRAKHVIEEFAVKDPQTAAKMAIEGRNEGYMRSLPIMALSHLSKAEDKTAFKTAFPQIVHTPRDLVEFIETTKTHRGLGHCIKKQINDYVQTQLTKDSAQFYTMKYRKQLEDAIRLGHTKSADPLTDYTMGKDIDLTPYNQLQAFETFKGDADLTPEEYVHLITDNRLEMQTVIGVRKPSPEVWEALAPNMSTFQIIKNVATLERQIGAPATLNAIKGRLTVESLKRGKVLPFRVFQAYDMAQDDQIKQFLGEIANEYPKTYDWSGLGRVCIAPDISGSMTNDIAQEKANNPKQRVRTVKPSKIAGMFSGILKVGMPDAILLPWADQARLYGDESLEGYRRRYLGDYFPERREEKKLDKPQNVLQIADQISSAAGGGTNLSAPIQWLQDHKEKIDTLIFITDSEEWQSPFLESWKQYKETIAPDARAILMRVDPYPTNPFPPEAAEKWGISQIYGWSDSVFKIVLPKAESETSEASSLDE